jgi:Na+-translocating ferredoxin:NAD+ oxidoreductase RnfE subunit
MRRKFFIAIWSGIRVVWPVLSGLLGLIAGLGVVIGRIEGWSVQESIYFAFVSGLTIGYGDFSPKTLIGRTLAIVIGICGILLTALVAAVAVKAFDTTSEEHMD